MRTLIPLLYAALAVASACEAIPPSPDPVAKQYADAWTKGNYKEMWDLLTDESRQRVGTEGFLDRLPRIAEEMTLRSLEATTGPSTRQKLPSGSPDPRSATVPLDVTFHTARVGDFRRSTTLSLVMVGEKDKAVWRIAWSPEAILPALSAGRLVRMTRIDTSRGRIIAREGTELATFIDGSNIGVIPGQVRSEDGLALSLAPIVGLTPDQIKAKLHQPWVRPDTFVPIRTLSGAQLDGIKAKLSVIEGVAAQGTRVRSYPTGLASQTLGYLAEASDAEAQARSARGVQAGDLIGKANSGLEDTLDDVLGGTYGWRLSIIEPNGDRAELLGETGAIPGMDVVLSLDPALQLAAENALGDRKGALVAEDPWSGEILAIASRPTFDLNAFANGDAINIARFSADARKPLFNRATFGQYPTGSSFKPITAAAAMREGVYKWGDRIDCPARWTGYGEQWAQLNHETGNLGLIDLRTALARSCNTFFYELGKRLNDKSPDLLPNAAKSFGLGKATDIDYVLEAEGLVPSPAWKAQRATDKTWNPGDATNLAIGQGFLLATPLQMANFAAALASDGIVWKPRLVIEIRDRPVGDPDGWFIGFASFEQPSIAFAAVFEEFHESPGNFASQVAGTTVRTVLGAKFGVK